MLLLQEAASPVMLSITSLHHEVMYVLLLTLGSVLYLLLRALANAAGNTAPMFLAQHTLLELIWTLVPSFLLLLIALPSFVLLYSLDELVNPALTVKAIGNQWYWSYEYADSVLGDALSYDSYMLPTSTLASGMLRLLETDAAMVLPILLHIRLLVTSADVLHSWALPSIGAKCDAVPGRLNQVSIFLLREGLLYGQCSEICGLQHGFMPINLEAVAADAFLSWLGAALLSS